VEAQAPIWGGAGRRAFPQILPGYFLTRVGRRGNAISGRAKTFVVEILRLATGAFSPSIPYPLWLPTPLKSAIPLCFHVMI
jgi:hypothetical protein